MESNMSFPWAVLVGQLEPCWSMSSCRTSSLWKAHGTPDTRRDWYLGRIPGENVILEVKGPDTPGFFATGTDCDLKI